MQIALYSDKINLIQSFRFQKKLLPKLDAPLVICKLFVTFFPLCAFEKQIQFDLNDYITDVVTIFNLKLSLNIFDGYIT